MKNEFQDLTDESTRKDLKEILKPIFGDLEDTQLNVLLENAEWVQINGGDRLIREGDVSESMYFLLQGRLTSVKMQKDGTSLILGDVSPGQSVGEIGVFSGEPRSASVYATRDSLLIQISLQGITKIAQVLPALILQVTKTIIHRSARLYTPGKINPAPVKCILFLTRDSGKVFSAFIDQFEKALLAHGTVKRLDAAWYNLEHNTHQRPEEYVITQNKLDDIEQQFDFVLLWANENDDLWLDHAIRHADVFYVVKDENDTPALSKAEELIFDKQAYFKLKEKALVRIHPDNTLLPKGTAAFLATREVTLHHHVRINRTTDYDRLARFVTHKAIGIAMSGGGAKCVSCVGLKLGLDKYGVPVDFYAGTSAGAIVAAVCAQDPNEERIMQMSAELAEESPTGKRNLSLVPLVSILSGRDLDKYLNKHFGKIEIEDLWINFTCVAADLSLKKKVIFREGRLDKAIRASISLPGVFPPAVLGNSLLLDGGLIENLPVETLRSFKVSKIIAVTVHATKSYKLHYSRTPESLEFLKNKIMGNKQMKVPGINTIIMESIVLASYSDYDSALQKSDLHLHPPVSKIGLMDWHKYKTLIKIGQSYIRDMDPNEIKERLGLV
jgi:NTE family protein